MKTSWLNGSKRILSALLIAAALMFGWTPLGEGKALAATDKGKLFAQAAMLFQKDELAFGQEIYGKNYTVFSNTGAWCAVFVSVIANRCGIPTSVIPNWANFVLKRVRRMPTVSTRLSIQVNIHMIHLRAKKTRYRITSSSMITMQRTVAMCRK